MMDYTRIANAVLRSEDLSPPAKLVFAIIASHLHDNEECFLSYSTLAKESGYSRDTVMRAIKELLVKRHNGHPYIQVRHVKRDHGGWAANHYSLNGLRIPSGSSTEQQGLSLTATRVVAESGQGSGTDRLEERSNEEQSNEELESARAREAIPYDQIVGYLNQKTRRAFSHKTEAHRKKIRTIWKELPSLGVSDRLAAFREVIDVKCQQWAGNPDMAQYLNPETLFRSFGRFEKYLNESPDYVRWANGREDSAGVQDHSADDERSVGQGDRGRGQSGAAPGIREGPGAGGEWGALSALQHAVAPGPGS